MTTGTRRYRTFALLFAGIIVLASPIPAPASGTGQPVEPGSVRSVQSFVGAHLATPADGRLRGYRFAANVLSFGTTDAAERYGTTLIAPPGQRLVAVSLRYDPLGDPDDTSHPVHGTVIVDGRRTALDDFDFVQAAEHSYIISVPVAAKAVELELAAASVAQTFSLTEGHRVGAQPAILYRDVGGSEVVSDVNAERTISATSDDGQHGAVAITLRRARLSWFSPGEPVTPPASVDQAYLIIEGSGDGVEPPYGSPDYGRFFSNFQSLPPTAITATLPDQRVVPAAHTGSQDGLLGGAYLFPVSADLTAAHITIAPTEVQGARYHGFNGQPARIHLDQPADFDVVFTPGTAPPAAADSTATSGAPATQRLPVTAGKRRHGHGGLLWILAAALASAVLVGWWRHHHRDTTVPEGGPERPAPTAEPEKPPLSPASVEPLLAVAGDRASLQGPGAVAALRAAILDALRAHEGNDASPSVILLADGPTRAVVPPDAPCPPGLVILGDHRDFLAEVDVAHLQHQHLVSSKENPATSPTPPIAPLLVIAPAPLKVPLFEALDETSHAPTGIVVLCLGPGPAPSLAIDDKGCVSAPDEGSPIRRVRTMSESQFLTELGRLAAAPPAGRSEAASSKPPPAPSTPRRVEPIDIVLFGHYRIIANGTEITTGHGLRGKARELLAYLAVHRQGVTADAAIEALWPGDDPARAQPHYRTLVANLRTVLRSATALPRSTAIIQWNNPRYRLDPALITVDLWRFEDALTAAASSDDNAADQAAKVYAGHLLVDEDYLWAEPLREELKRKAIDHLTALAERKHGTGDINGAGRALERAIEHDPYTEDHYERIIRLQLATGRPDAARRTYQLLQRRLSELNLTPSKTIQQLIEGDRA